MRKQASVAPRAQVHATLKRAKLGLDNDEIAYIASRLSGNSHNLTVSSLGFEGQEKKLRKISTDRALLAAANVVIDAYLSGEATLAALGLLYKVVNDDKAPLPVRVNAANSLLDRAGRTAKRAEQTPERHETKRAASAADIERQIAALEAELAGKTVEIVNDLADSVPHGDQAFDFIE